MKKRINIGKKLNAKYRFSSSDKKEDEKYFTPSRLLLSLIFWIILFFISFNRLLALVSIFALIFYHWRLFIAVIRLSSPMCHAQRLLPTDSRCIIDAGIKELTGETWWKETAESQTGYRISIGIRIINWNENEWKTNYTDGKIRKKKSHSNMLSEPNETVAKRSKSAPSNGNGNMKLCDTVTWNVFKWYLWYSLDVPKTEISILIVDC